MTEEESLLWYGVKTENELQRDREAVLLPTYRDGGRFVNNHNVLVHVNYGDRVGGNRYFMPETNQQCSFDTITHSTGGRGTTFTLVHKMHCNTPCHHDNLTVLIFYGDLCRVIVNAVF